MDSPERDFNKQANQPENDEENDNTPDDIPQHVFAPSCYYTGSTTIYNTLIARDISASVYSTLHDFLKMRFFVRIT